MNNIRLKHLLLISIYLLSFVLPTSSWLLSQVGLNESYRIRHLSTHYSRVFLCISVKSNTFPTLIEAEWPARYLPTGIAVYPYRNFHANGDHTDCSRIQQAVWTHVDSLSRLWIMDIGWEEDTEQCPPKLLVFDLIRNNAQILEIDCGKFFQPNDVDNLVIKMGPVMVSRRMEKYIYFILSNSFYVMAYDIIEQSWHKYKLKSQKFKSIAEKFPIKPVDITFGKYNELLISDQDGYLYSSITPIYLSNSIMKLDSDDNIKSIELVQLGSLLGPTKSMMIDPLGALFYVQKKLGVVVRCEYKRNLQTEDNEIIYITSKNLQQIFVGVEGSIWLLTERELKPHDHCYPG